MKRIICFTLLVMSFIGLVSCSSNQTYTILESSDYDYTSEAAHNSEFVLNIGSEKEIDVVKNQTFEIDGATYNAEYTWTQNSYIYQNRRKVYFSKFDGVIVEIGVDDATGEISIYTYYAPSCADCGLSELTQDECLNIAEAFLSVRFNDLDSYELAVEEGDMGGVPLYRFEYVRMFNNIPSSDRIYISVSKFGDVIDYRFENPGHMKDAKLPSPEDMKTIEDGIDAKLASIYEPLKESYTYAYTIEDIEFTRLEDGHYALLYEINVDLQPLSDEPEKLLELTSLVIYFD